MTEFSGKAILVLGGSRGIGADIVRRFARDGGTVAFSYFGSQEAAEALTAETRTEALRCDSADRDAVVALVRGRPALDVMVVNAGLFVGGDPLALDAAAVDRMIDVNVRSPYHAAVEAGRRMGEGGRIVLVGSTNGDRVPWPSSAAYGMTKSAMQGMARGLARDFGVRGITVNVVQPGPVDTDEPRRRSAERPDAFGHGDQAPRDGQGDRWPCRLPCRTRSCDRHRRHAHHRRRLRRLTDPSDATHSVGD